MKPENRPEPTKPLDQNDLQKLPRNTMAKSMRNLEEIIAAHGAGQGLTREEARLLDRHLFETTGEHLPDFVKLPVEPPQVDYVVGKARRRPDEMQVGELTFTGTKIPLSESTMLPNARPDAIPDRESPEPSESVS